MNLIDLNLESDPKLKVRKLSFSNHAWNHKISTESGMSTRPISAKGRSHNSRTFDGDPNVNLERELHPEKHSPPTNSTDVERSIERSNAQSLNAVSSIRTTPESPRNGLSTRRTHP
jgi:hypothetical protein